MKCLYNLTALFTWFAISVFNNNIKAQNFHLVKDINDVTNSNPLITQNCVLNGICYFTADDGVHGRELWRTDGTEEGTYLLKDVNPGLVSSEPRNITLFKNKIYFLASSPNDKLWVSDGTIEGTKVFSDFNNPAGLTVSDNFLFFAYSNKIWKSDGTENGTVMVADFYNAPYNGYITSLTGTNHRLFLSVNAYDASLFQTVGKLWTSDGTAAGTYLVSNSALNPKQVTALNDSLICFSAMTSSSNYNYKFWFIKGRTDTAVATPDNSDINVNTQTNFITLEDKLYFIGFSSSDKSAYTSLFKYDERSGVMLVKKFSPLDNSSGIGNVINVGKSIYFSYNNYFDPVVSPGALWKSDGTTAGTMMIKDSCNPLRFINANGQLYFLGIKNQANVFWKSDGTTSGTLVFKTGVQATSSSMTYLSGATILFSGSTGKDFELYKSDGTSSGTLLVKDINTFASESSNIAALKAINGKLLFTDLSKLWMTDGSSPGTKNMQLSVIPLSSLSGFTSLGDNVYFKGGDSLTGHEGLYKMNSGATTVTLVKDFTDIHQTINWMVAADSLIFFSTQDYYNNKYSLWRTNGTAEGTFEVKSNAMNIPYWNNLQSDIRIYPTTVGGTLFFVQQNSNRQWYELWASDGTQNGTRLIKDMINYYPIVCSYKGNVYFSVNSENGNFLWKTDGTTEGTSIVTSKVSNIEKLTISNEILYFKGNSLEGNELWRTDGTDQGTLLVRDINTTSDKNSDPNNLVDVGGVLYFFANDGIHGNELWKSNGTKNSTALVKDVTPGLGSSYPYLTNYQYIFPSGKYMINGGGRLILNLNGSLWISDGTDTGTHVIADAGLSGVTEMYNLIIIRDQLYFTAYTHQYGVELYGGKIDLVLLPKYTFIGSGNFDNSDNWINGMVPPENIPAGVEIVIDPPAGKICNLNVPLRLTGGKFTVRKNAKVVTF